MDEAKLREIEARANAATTGPWEVVSRSGVGQVRAVGRILCGVVAAHDAELMAHARTDVPALVDEVRRLTAALATARREGAEAMRERCDDALTARLVEAVREVREKTYRGTGAEKDIATAVWEAIDAMRDAIRALPLDAPGGAT